jgi:hypothetical protein
LKIVALSEKQTKELIVGKKRVVLFAKTPGSIILYPDESWHESFCHLLLEIFELWNEKSSSPRPVLPISFHHIYLTLVSAGVVFPKAKKFIDWPKSCARTTEACSEQL